MEENNQKKFTVTAEILASHSQRFLNLLMDYIGQLFLFIIAFSIAVTIAETNGNKDFAANFVKNDIAQYTFVACISLVYYNVFEIFFARTIGKFITQTIVVDENGEKPNHERILVRTLCRLIPFEILSFIGMPARGWHDSISKTFVVNKNLLDENEDIIFDTKTQNGNSVKYELALLEKKGNQLFPIYTKDEYGRNVKLEFDNDEYNIIKISEYREPELIHDYQTKNKINVNTFLSKYLSKQGVKMVSKLNNKIIVQNEEDINLFVLKSDNDALRFIESLTERFVKLKRGDCMFVNDSSGPQKKYLYNLLEEKGFNKDFLYRKETTYSVGSSNLFKM